MCHATHAQKKTNGYDFPLTTVVVVDEFGEGFPVAWCISNKNSSNERLKDLKWWHQGFMAHDWHGRAVLHSMVCSIWPWHKKNTVHMACWLSLERPTKADESKLQYKTIFILLEETDCKTFESLLKATVEQLQTNTTTQTFATYFIQYYGKSGLHATAKKLMLDWTQTCTCTYVESFHSTEFWKHAYRQQASKLKWLLTVDRNETPRVLI